jgi:succinyl-diaminopimelate desuccinylase
VSRATDLLAELVRTDTVGAHEGASARRCAEILDAAGLEGRLLDWEPGRAQYVAHTGGSDGPLTFTGHLDVVPVSRADWASDPFSPEVDGDRMIGRGTSDMLSGVAALTVAVSDHVATPHTCRGVQVVLTAGEETGCTGALALRRDDLVPGGPLVVAEPTANRLVPGHKGAHWLRLRTAGRAAHGSAPELGDNAAVKVARAAVALHDHDGWPAGMTTNVGVLRAGAQTNVVPDAGELLLDVRTVPGIDRADVHEAVAAVAGPEVTLEDEVVLPPVSTDHDDPFLALVAGALDACGAEPTPADQARYFTDASVLVPLLTAAGGRPTPAVVLGPGEPDQCHVADEWCSLTRVEEAVEIYSVLLRSWCGDRIPRSA